jgi:hypothetical protein
LTSLAETAGMKRRKSRNRVENSPMVPRNRPTSTQVGK